MLFSATIKGRAGKYEVPGISLIQVRIQMNSVVPPPSREDELNRYALLLVGRTDVRLRRCLAGNLELASDVRSYQGHNYV